MDGSPPTSKEAPRLRSKRPLTWAASALLACALAVGGSLTAGVVAPSAEAVGDCTAGSDWGTVRSDFASRTVSLVNAHRASLGLVQLSVSGALAASSTWKARHMAKYEYMAHSDPAPPVARSTGERMQACGVTGSWGENIAYGYSTPEQVVQGWLGSPGHKANIENPNYRTIGAGAAVSANGQVYWAHAFSTAGSGSSPPPGPGPGPAPSPGPSPGPAPGQPVTAAQASSKTGVVLRNLQMLAKPRAGRTMASSVGVFKRGAKVRTAHVFCSARLDGRALRVLAHRFHTGKATCAWKVPTSARGKLVNAAIVVQQGRSSAHAPFRARVAG